MFFFLGGVGGGGWGRAAQGASLEGKPRPFSNQDSQKNPKNPKSKLFQEIFRRGLDFGVCAIQFAQDCTYSFGKKYLNLRFASLSWCFLEAGQCKWKSTNPKSKLSWKKLWENLRLRMFGFSLYF